MEEIDLSSAQQMSLREMSLDNRNCGNIHNDNNNNPIHYYHHSYPFYNYYILYKWVMFMIMIISFHLYD